MEIFLHKHYALPKNIYILKEKERKECRGVGRKLTHLHSSPGSLMFPHCSPEEKQMHRTCGKRKDQQQ